MTKQELTLKLSSRDVIGKGLGHLRRQGLVPAVVHDHGKSSLHVMAELPVLLKVYDQAGKHHPLHLEVEGKKRLALIKDVDFEPVKHRMRHVVFQAIRQNEKVQAEVPLELVGEIPAEKAGLMVITGVAQVLVEALPSDLPDILKVDASILAEIGDKITVADIIVPDGVSILTESEQPVATIEETKAQIAEEAAESSSEGDQEDAEDSESEEE